MNDYMIRQGATVRYESLVREADTHRGLRGATPGRKPRLDSLASLGLTLAVLLSGVLS